MAFADHVASVKRDMARLQTRGRVAPQGNRSLTQSKQLIGKIFLAVVVVVVIILVTLLASGVISRLEEEEESE